MSVLAVIPLVSGRHRNRALAAARHARAIQLATEGRTYQEIADELGYANRGTVHHIVHQVLARDRKLAVETHQQLEMARLDALQVALWDQAIADDLDACREVRAIIMARVRLLGLIEQAKRPTAWIPRTVVLTAEDCEALELYGARCMLNCLRTNVLRPSRRRRTLRRRIRRQRGRLLGQFPRR